MFIDEYDSYLRKQSSVRLMLHLLKYYPIFLLKAIRQNRRRWLFVAAMKIGNFPFYFTRNFDKIVAGISF